MSGPTAAPDEAATRILAGDRRALARAFSWLENGDPRGATVLARLRSQRGERAPAPWIGITGPPGSGKSSLSDRLVQRMRADGLSVAVIAVDPSSPFAHGALLGDRIRLTRWFDDPQVFVRSCATRGQLGGLAVAALRGAALLEAAGFDRILLETVGVGQSETEIASVADAVLLVLAPNAGDDVQAVKAGVMEIADLYVIHKCDLPGADALARQVRDAQRLVEPKDGETLPEVLRVSSTQDEGVDELLTALAQHLRRVDRELGTHGRRRARARAELAAALRSQAARLAAAAASEALDRIADGSVTAEDAAREALTGLACEP